ncbi:MAG TPA: MFS transporter [Oceanipulchritudo sp.]|nr:MFS transporter [Oceanipulchritudo sp.]
MNPNYGSDAEAEKAASRKLWFARAACLLQVGCMAQLSVYEAVHMQDKGLSGTMIGVVMATHSALLILTGPIWGRMADRYRFHRRLIAIGTLGMCGTLAWFALANSTVDFFVYALMKGLLLGSVMGVMPALILSNLPPHSQGQGFGGVRSFGSIGFMVGTLALPALFPSISSIVLIAALLLPISIYFVFGLDRPAQRTAEEEIAFGAKLPTLLYWFLAAHFLVSLTDPAINGFFNGFARTMGAPIEWIGVLSGINGFLAFVSLPLMGLWVDKRGATGVLLLGYAAQGLRLLTASFITTPEWLWVPQLFHCFGWAGREVATIVFVTLLVGPTKRATAVTLAISTNVAGMMVGSFLMGRLSDLYGYPIMFRIIAALAGGSLIFLFYVLSGIKKRS